LRHDLLAEAGNETTTRLIGWTGRVLAERPDPRRTLVEDRSLIPNAIEELLRYEAPSPVPARYISADVEHYGRKIAAGNVMVLLSAHRATETSATFPEPDRFDIKRTTDHHLSFGYGTHEQVRGREKLPCSCRDIRFSGVSSEPGQAHTGGTP
jgi:cytochrome P450